jgi:hypothetical protein
VCILCLKHGLDTKTKADGETLLFEKKTQNMFVFIHPLTPEVVLDPFANVKKIQFVTLFFVFLFNLIC